MHLGALTLEPGLTPGRPDLAGGGEVRALGVWSSQVILTVHPRLRTVKRERLSLGWEFSRAEKKGLVLFSPDIWLAAAWKP